LDYVTYFENLVAHLATSQIDNSESLMCSPFNMTAKRNGIARKAKAHCNQDRGAKKPPRTRTQRPSCFGTFVFSKKEKKRSGNKAQHRESLAHKEHVLRRAALCPRKARLAQYCFRPSGPMSARRDKAYGRSREANSKDMSVKNNAIGRGGCHGWL